MSNPENGRNTDESSLHNGNNPASATPDQGRSAFSAGTTKQGDTNSNQGASQLGGEAYKQGNDAGKSSENEKEAGKLNTEQALDSPKEQEQVAKEREHISNGRSEDQVDTERTTPDPDEAHRSDKEPRNPATN